MALASPLEAAVSKAVAAGFKGKLLSGTLRREAVSALDSLGDAQSPVATTFPFEGIRDTFSLAFAQAAGIPVTDVRILIIAGSLATTPEQDDQIFIRGEWFQLRALVEQDPANATYTFSAFRIPAP